MVLGDIQSDTLFYIIYKKNPRPPTSLLGTQLGTQTPPKKVKLLIYKGK